MIGVTQHAHSHTSIDCVTNAEFYYNPSNCFEIIYYCYIHSTHKHICLVSHPKRNHARHAAVSTKGILMKNLFKNF